MFTRDHVPALSWRAEADVFCKEVDPADGDLYKIEAFAGVEIIAWVRRSAPLVAFFTPPALRGITEAQATFRGLWTPPGALRARVLAHSRRATADGVAYASYDLMRKADGTFVVIEWNVAEVSTWWTTAYPFARRRFAEAVADLPALRTRGALARLRALTTRRR